MTFRYNSALARVSYECGAVALEGSVLFTAGACPLDAGGKVVAVGDPVTQTSVALDNLNLTLARFGARPKDLVKTTIYVVGGRGDLTAVWDVMAAWMAPLRPASTLLGVSILGYVDQLVEIEAIASIGDAGRREGLGSDWPGLDDIE